MADLIQLKVSELYPHPDNPRKEIGDVTELADSIKANGIFQNLTVVPRAEGGYTVIIGHRRLSAAKQAGLEMVPCVIAEMTAEEQLQTMLLENMQRSDLTIYEQAQGFQMLLDFGKSVDEIAEKSGFSKSTVRRRLKMNELDQDLLKRVSETRQLNLMDFDEIAKIESIEGKNEALKEIGTSNFQYKVKGLLREQEINKYKDEAFALMKERNIQELNMSGRYSANQERIATVMIDKWPTSKDKVPEPKDGEKLSFWYERFSGSLEIFKRIKRERRVVDEEKQKRDADIKQAWEYIYQQANICYELRQDFIKHLTLNAKNKEVILMGALLAGALNSMTYNTSSDKVTMEKLVGISTVYADYSKKHLDILKGLKNLQEKDIVKMVYALYGDHKRRLIGNSHTNNWPIYTPDVQVQMLYHWLEMLGYEMCAIEKELVFGTSKHYENPYAKK